MTEKADKLYLEIRELEEITEEKRKKYREEVQKTQIEFLTANIGKCFTIDGNSRPIKIISIDFDKKYSIAVKYEELSFHHIERDGRENYWAEYQIKITDLSFIYEDLLAKTTKKFSLEEFEDMKSRIMSFNYPEIG